MFCALLGGAAPVAAAPRRDVPTSPGSMQPGTCATVADPIDYRPQAAQVGEISNIVYLNRCIGGCAITKVANGQTDARQDWSETVDADITFPEFAVEPADWAAVMACVQNGFDAYDIVVTDVDPMDASHHETVVSGLAGDIGLPASVLGISRLSPVCAPYDNSISFAFAFHPAHSGPSGVDVGELCTTIVHEVGHAYGMEHAYFCQDVMTYIADECGEQKFFRDELMQCGEGFGSQDQDPSDDIRPCTCGGSQQNTHLKMSQVFAANPDLPVPEVEIVSPEPDATVTDGFPIFANASNGLRGIGGYTLLINGWPWAEEDLHTYDDSSQLIQITVPASVPDGYLDIELQVDNDIRTDVGVAALTVLKGAPCTTAEACADGQTCGDGRCFWAPPSLALGEACEFDQACLSNTCEQGTCTQTCLAGVADQCPDGLACVAPDGTSAGFCLVEGGGDDGGGCCMAASSRGGIGAQLALGLLVALALVRPRRRGARHQIDG